MGTSQLKQPPGHPAHAVSRPGAQPLPVTALISGPRFPQDLQIPCNQVMLPEPGQAPASQTRILPPLAPNGPCGPPAPWAGTRPRWVVPSTGLTDAENLHYCTEMSGQTEDEPRKKLRAQFRAVQACNSCRVKKAKCDEIRPTCSYCKTNKLECNYSEGRPNKVEKSVQPLVDRIQELEDNISKKLESLAMLLKTQEDGRQGSQPTVSPTSWALQNNLNCRVKNTDEREENEGKLAFTMDHVTAAHKLFMWPSIRQLLPTTYDPDYAMQLEEQRELVSSYGKGEGSGITDGTSIPTPPPLVDCHRRKIRSNVKKTSIVLSITQDPGIDNLGLFSLDAEIAWRYYQSYLSQVHKIHPFMWEHELEVKVQNFIRHFCQRSSQSESESDARCQGKKRKWDDERDLSLEAESESYLMGHHIDNAIILLIFALGAICERPSPLSSPITEPNAEDYQGQYIPLLVNSGLSQPPPKHDSMITQFSNDSIESARIEFNMPRNSSYRSFQDDEVYSTSSDLKQNFMKQNSLDPRDTHCHVKKSDALPGLALFGYASTILGSHRGGVGLQHVHASLLAGLYAGLLAHPFQSHSWICEAARACQVLTRPRQYDRLPDCQFKDQIKFAYWTCLQLESDLLAGLDLPASGISRSASRIDRPSGRFTMDCLREGEARSPRMMLFYLSQIRLCEIVSYSHAALAEVDGKGDTGRWFSSLQESLSADLELWRSNLPDDIAWREADPPAPNIDAARLRAKYYGAHHFIHLPILYHVLHSYQSGARVISVPGVFASDKPNGSVSNLQSQQVLPSRCPPLARCTILMCSLVLAQPILWLVALLPRHSMTGLLQPMISAICQLRFVVPVKFVLSLRS